MREKLINIDDIKKALMEQDSLNYLPVFYSYAECNFRNKKVVMGMMKSSLHCTDYHVVEDMYKPFF